MTGQDLKELIADNGITAYKLADMLDVTHVTVYSLFKYTKIPKVYELAVRHLIYYPEYQLVKTLGRT